MTKVAFSDSRSMPASPAPLSDPASLGRQAHRSQHAGGQPGQDVGGGHLVAVGAGRGVAGHADDVLDGRFAVDHGLSGAGDFRAYLADHVEAQENSDGAVEDQIEQVVPADDDPARRGADSGRRASRKVLVGAPPLVAMVPPPVSCSTSATQ